MFPRRHWLQWAQFENGGSPKKIQKSFAEIQKGATPAPEKAGSSPCLPTFAAVVYNHTLVFCHESNFSVFLLFSVFLMATNLVSCPLQRRGRGPCQLLVTRLELSDPVCQQLSSAQENHIWSHQPCRSRKWPHVCKHSTGLRRSGTPWAGVGMLPRQNIYDYGQEPWSCDPVVYQGLQSQSAPCMPTPELQL